MWPLFLMGNLQVSDIQGSWLRATLHTDQDPLPWILGALEHYEKVVLWKREMQFCYRWDVKFHMVWIWTMLRTHNIFSGQKGQIVYQSYS